MMKLTSICSAAVLCTIGAITSHAQTVTCENAQYDPALLEKYPNLPQRCFDVVNRDGENYAVVKARLDKVLSNNNIIVSIKRPDGTYSEPTKLRTKGTQQVMVKGQPTHIQDVPTGQELTAYIRVHEPAMALEPVATEALVITPLQEHEHMAAALPSTGSFTPLLGLLGSISLLLGGLLTVVRIRRR